MNLKLGIGNTVEFTPKFNVKTGLKYDYKNDVKINTAIYQVNLLTQVMCK